MKIRSRKLALFVLPMAVTLACAPLGAPVAQADVSPRPLPVSANDLSSYTSVAAPVGKVNTTTELTKIYVSGNSKYAVRVPYDFTAYYYKCANKTTCVNVYPSQVSYGYGFAVGDGRRTDVYYYIGGVWMYRYSAYAGWHEASHTYPTLLGAF